MSEEPVAEMTTAALWQPPSLRVVNPVADKLTFDQELERARQQGYKEGLAQGQEEGRQQARTLLAQMSALWDAMQQPFADMEHEVHSELTGLAIAIAESVLRRELKTDRELINKAMLASLDALGSIEHTLDVELNPRDRNLVASLLDEQHIDYRIKENPNVMPGGCRLRHGHALVDNTIEALIAEIIAGVADQSRLTDAMGSEAARPLDGDEIASIAKRFAAGGDVDE
ncbi:MAG: hypothetical protein RLZZ602_1058 [Pseudomonadota bacterium]|jgi:flagellar assembly protein FliH